MRAVALAITLAMSLAACGATPDPATTPAVVQSPSPTPRADPTAWDLRGFDDVVEQDADWFASIGITFKAVDRGSADNPRGIDISFKGPVAAADAIEAHYGNPPWLRAIWRGPGEWTGALGDLDVSTTDAVGRPVPYVDIDFAAVDLYQVDADPGYGVQTDEQGHRGRTYCPRGSGSPGDRQRPNDRSHDHQIAGRSSRAPIRPVSLPR